ncbi:non-specific serine/threonine protein kinase [Trifolium repens]|nr:non-specific serine/threonine protein kinase [Trifolium repens]
MALDDVVHHRFHLFSHYLTVLLLLVLTSKGNGHRYDCPESFDCGYLGSIRYPFTTVGFPNCGALAIQGCDDTNKTATKTIQLTNGGRHFQVTNTVNDSPKGNTVSIIDQNFTKLLLKNGCEAFSYDNITLPPSSPFGLFYMKDNITAFKCKRTEKFVINPPNNFFKNSSCPHYDFYFGDSISDEKSNSSFASCSLFHLPVIEIGFALSGNPFKFLADEITFQFQSSDDCQKCYNLDEKIHCQVNSNGQLYCPARKGGRGLTWKLGLILGDRLELNQDLELKCIKNEIDEEMVRKMTVVSLWCIQTDPSNRPAMHKVVEMLEGSLQVLEIPPKPYLYSPASSIHLSSEIL